MSTSNTNAQVDQFLQAFNQLKSEIESNLTSATSTDCQQNGLLTTKLACLERLLSESAAYLPPYMQSITRIT